MISCQRYAPCGIEGRCRGILSEIPQDVLKDASRCLCETGKYACPEECHIRKILDSAGLEAGVQTASI
jgi:hypothetical protein